MPCVSNKYVFIDLEGRNGAVGCVCRVEKRKERATNEHQEGVETFVGPFTFHPPFLVSPSPLRWFHGIGCKGLAVLPASQKPEWLSRSPILMASNRFEPNGMANV